MSISSKLQESRSHRVHHLSAFSKSLYCTQSVHACHCSSQTTTAAPKSQKSQHATAPGLGNGPGAFTEGRFTAPECSSEERVGQAQNLIPCPSWVLPLARMNHLFFGLISPGRCAHAAAAGSEPAHTQLQKTFHSPSLRK